MNGGMNMDLNFVRSAVTLFSLAIFLALMAWTWWPRRKAAMEAAAQLPFTGEADDGGARRAECRAVTKPTRAPSEGRAMYPSTGGLQ